MRTEQVEETTEANQAAARSVVLPRTWGRMAMVRRPRSAGALAALVRLLSGATGAARSAVLAQAAELIREATGADRVGIHLEASLRDRERDGESAALRRRSVQREIRCLGPAGPVALILLEGGVAASAAPREEDALLEAVAGLVAGYLERDRLERELAALQTTRARGERLAQLGSVASASAHDLNNVLTAIVGYADLLALELGLESDSAPALASASGRGGVAAASGSAPGSQELEEIRIAAARGASIVEEVLGFVRTRPVGDSEHDVSRLVARLEPMLRRVAGARIAVSFEALPGLPAACLDGEHLERVLVNLVVNARHAIEAARGAGAEGEIEITLERARGARSPQSGEDALRLVVRDDGCGMSDDLKRRVFEPFFTTRSALGGTGLGLAAAADFARRAGGRIEVESREGKGTAVALVLPAAASPANPTPPRNEEAAEKPTVSR